jgi:hypothetical protein
VVGLKVEVQDPDAAAAEQLDGLELAARRGIDPEA